MEAALLGWFSARACEGLGRLLGDSGREQEARLYLISCELASLAVAPVFLALKCTGSSLTLSLSFLSLSHPPECVCLLVIGTPGSWKLREARDLLLLVTLPRCRLCSGVLAPDTCQLGKS